MSDPMTNIEIEDVLSSIRRLVAQDVSPPRPPGRLVLTPAQRVDDAAPAAPTVALTPEPDEGRHGDAAAAPESAPMPDQTKAGAEDHGPEADTRYRPSADRDAEATDTEPVPTVGHDGHAARPQSLEETVAELEAAMLRNDSDWEAEDTDPADPQWQDETVLAGLAFLRSGGAAAEVPMPLEHPEPSTAQMQEPHPGEDLEDVEEHLSAWKPPAGPDPEEILDEEMLRHLIAEVLREELRGELGRKITSSLRGMIRREVQVALSGLLRN